MNRDEIKRILPHREPFLLLTEVSDLEPGTRCRASWRLTGEEDFFRGHFPNNPLLPGVMIVESMSQAGAVAVLSLPEYAGRLVLFGGADKVKFRRGVRPGDTLELDLTITQLGSRGGRGAGTARVGGELCAEAEILFIFAQGGR